MTSHRTQVLVVGAGPVGLSTALFLGRQGIGTTVIEKRSTISQIPRATGVHARTMEVFRGQGLEPALQARGMKFANLSDLDLEAVAAGRETPLAMYAAPSLAELGHHSRLLENHDTRYENFSPCWPLWCGQDRYEPVLLADATAHGATVRFRTRLVALDRSGDTVLATVEDADGNRGVVEADYVVGADGVRSSVRELLGIGVQSHGVADRFVSIIMRAELDTRGKPPFTFISLSNPRQPGLLLHIEPGRWMIGAIYDPERGESAADVTPERAREIARTVSGDPDLQPLIESITPWEARHQVADTYRVGRVLLAGDAAHCHPPAGGFGVNTGIQDAHNLAWKLAAVLRGRAGAQLVDSYEVERRPVGVATSDQAWGLFATRARRVDEAELGEGERRSVHRNVAVATGYRYRDGVVIGTDPTTPVVPDELRFDGEPGSRAPHVWVRHDGTTVSTLDLVSTEFVLVAGERAHRWVDAAAVAAAAGHPVRAHQLGADLTDLEGRGGTCAEQLGIGADGAVLLRPDGFVAWRTDRPAPSCPTGRSTAVSDLLAVLLHTSRPVDTSRPAGEVGAPPRPRRPGYVPAP